jgi:hypothetical protein
VREETKKIYYSSDGRVFDKKHECEDHEMKLEQIERDTSYWLIVYHPDIDDDTVYYGCTLARAYLPSYGVFAQNLMEDFCYSKLGSQFDYIMGAFPMRSWKLSKATKEDFFKGNPVVYCGGYRYEGNRICLKYDQGKGLIDDEEAYRAEFRYNSHGK